LALKPTALFIRITGLLIVAGVNFIVGSMLLRISQGFSHFSSSLLQFYSPVETVIRVMSFSPLFYTALGAVGSMFIPIITEHLDYNLGRQMSIKAIKVAEEKLEGVRSVQAVMRNVRELIKVTSHVQTLAEGLSQRKIDRAAGRAIVTEGTNVAGKICRWTGNKIKETFSSPEPSECGLVTEPPIAH